jgi:hypothetical protein
MVDGSQRIGLPDEGRWYVPPFCDMGKIRRCRYPLWSRTQSKIFDYRDMSKAAGRREDTTQPPMYVPEIQVARRVRYKNAGNQSVQRRS